MPRQGDGGHVDLDVLGPVAGGLRHPQAPRCARRGDRAGRGVLPGICHVCFFFTLFAVSRVFFRDAWDCDCD